MKYLHILSGVTAITFFMTGVPSFAEQGDGGKHHRGKGHKIEKMDVDGDGRVTLEEAGTVTKEHFKKMDGDGDGLVTKEEMTTKFKEHKLGKEGLSEEKKEKMQKLFDRKFEESDANADGAISEDEFVAKSQKHLEKLDVNNDGVIEKDEVAARMQEMRKKVEDMRQKHEQGTGEVDGSE